MSLIPDEWAQPLSRTMRCGYVLMQAQPRGTFTRPRLQALAKRPRSYRVLRRIGLAHRLYSYTFNVPGVKWQ